MSPRSVTWILSIFLFYSTEGILPIPLYNSVLCGLRSWTRKSKLENPNRGRRLTTPQSGTWFPNTKVLKTVTWPVSLPESVDTHLLFVSPLTRYHRGLHQVFTKDDLQCPLLSHLPTQSDGHSEPRVYIVHSQGRKRCDLFPQTEFYRVSPQDIVTLFRSYQLR